MSEKIKMDFRKRFVSDYNLPIQVLISPYFEERLIQCEKLYNANTKYYNLLNYISESFDNNIGKFLNTFYEYRDIIITDILKKESYQKFNTRDLNQFKLTNQYPKKNLYAEDMVNKVILTIDLSKANFQALKFIDSDIINNCNSYDDFIKYYCDIPYLRESKYTRQVIFGKLNPSRQITIERFLLEKIHKKISTEFELFNFGNDELMYFSPKSFIKDNCDDTRMFYKDFEDKLVKQIKDELNLDIKVSFIKIEPIKFKMGNEQTLTIFKKIYLSEIDKFKIMTCPVTYMPQVLRLLNHEEIQTNDLAFMYENNLAFLATPLKLV